MAYNRRNDENGRVVGFRDGQPVYKKAGRGGKDDRSERRGPHRQDGARPEGGRKFDERGERPFGNTYNKKEQGGQERGERGRREQYGNRGGARPDQRDGYERSDRPYRGRSFGNGGREGAQRFENEKFRTKAEEFEQIRPPRREKYSDNFKPLPQDIREEQPEVELPNIIMGRNPVKEAIKTGRSIDRILVLNEHDGSLNEILDLAYEAKLVVRNVERAKLDEICMPFGHNGKPGNHQGIIAYVPEAQYCELTDILDYAKEKGEHPFVVLLDGIEDPHNLGSIIRSAECAGAHGIVIPKRRAASVTAAVVKTSVVNLAVAIERLKEAGIWVAGADMGGEPMYKADLKGPFALVVGAEGAGLSRLVREKCDYIVSVPLKGKMESLNASVAAAVIMFEKVRQESNR